MSDFKSPYPRPILDARRPDHWRTVDRCIAVILFAIALIPSVLVTSFGLLLFLAFPVPFFWWPGARSHLTFLLLAIPHYFLLYVACDMINDRSSPYLHAMHQQYWIVAVYAVIRCASMWARRADEGASEADELV